MPQKVAFITESTTAQFTRVRRLSSVNQLVLFQIEGRMESGVALITGHLLVFIFACLLWFLLVASHVACQLGEMAERIVTVVTVKHPLVCFTPMRAPGFSVEKVLVALITAVNLPRMFGH